MYFPHPVQFACPIDYVKSAGPRLYRNIYYLHTAVKIRTGNLHGWGGTIFIVRKQIRCISRFGSSGIRQTGYAASSGYEDGNKEEKDYDQDKTTGHPLHDFTES